MPEPSAPAAAARPSGAALWLERMKLAVRVMFFIELGMLLVLLPWTPLWTNNSLLSTHLSLREWLNLGFVRGAMSGLGLVNIWFGIYEAVHYRET
ncbi:MAG: hypothetical protein HYX26_06545 [Acidobacteriales bacterium]|nr:hypothetical protein [Terriglobales bacterium]